MPQTYDEDYRWSVYPDDLGKIERDIERKVAIKAHERRVMGKQKMGGGGAGGGKTAASVGDDGQCLHDQWYSHGGGAGGSRPTGNGSRRMARRRSSGTTISTEKTEKSVGDRSLADIDDAIMASRDASDLMPNEMLSEMPDDPIMSERSDYESQISA